MNTSELAATVRAKVQKRDWIGIYYSLPFLAKWALWACALIALWHLIELALGHELFMVDPTKLPTITDSALVQAAWFQAIGSIAAIVAAIWVAKRQSETSRELVEEERRRRASIEAGALIPAFHGVALEARTKGRWVLELARSADYSTLLGTQKSDARRMRLHSIELLVPHYNAVGSLSTTTGMNMALAFAYVTPYNITLDDVLTRSARGEEDLRKIFYDVARRMATAQQVSRNALLLLRHHPAFSEDAFRTSTNLDWYDVGDIDLEADLQQIALPRDDF